MQLDGKTAIVTGGAVRLGKALALALADQGVNVVLHYGKSAQQAEQTCREIKERGVAVVMVQADLALAEPAARQILAAGVEAFGTVDVLINGAAIFEAATLRQTTEDIWDRHLAINLKAPCFLTRELANHFAQRPADSKPRGHVLNVIDWRGTRPSAGISHLAYTIAKSGLAALTKALAVELAPEIQVNAIAPGAILPPPGADDEFLRQLAARNPLQRIGSVQEITRAALFLLQSEFITGEIVHVTGGEQL